MFPHRRLRLLLTLLFLYACSTTGFGGQDVPYQGIGTNTVDKKVDPSLLAEINRPADQRAGREIDVIIRTRGPMGPAERTMIEELDGQVGSVLGDISVARIPVGRIADVARLDFVVYIEKAKKLHPK